MPGHINRGSLLGELIYNTVNQPDIKIIVEIGTWNGQGSTQCVIDGLKNKSDFKFISIESSAVMHQEALKNIGNIPGVELLLGRIIEPEDIPELSLNETQKKWLQEDLANYDRTSNIIEKIPLEIDLIIFDGGEFTSELEFNLVSRRAHYIIMDDTNPATETIKFIRIRKNIIEGKTPFRIIQDNLFDRYGWLFAKNSIFD